MVPETKPTASPNGYVVFNPRGQRQYSFPHGPQNPTHPPPLCTHSADASQFTTSHTTAQNHIVIPAANGNSFRGYRDKKSWRFAGMPYAAPSKRQEYSTVYSGADQWIGATAFSSQRAQVGRGSEDCSFVDVQTPYIPKAGDETGLKAVYFWIRGGASITVWAALPGPTAEIWRGGRISRW